MTKSIIKILIEYNSVGFQIRSFKTRIFICFMSFYILSSTPQYLFRHLGFQSCIFRIPHLKQSKYAWPPRNNHSIFILWVYYKITELNCFCLTIFVSSGCVWAVFSSFSLSVGDQEILFNIKKKKSLSSHLHSGTGGFREKTK